MCDSRCSVAAGVTFAGDEHRGSPGTFTGGAIGECVQYACDKAVGSENAQGNYG
jgi:hypothetical protein